MAQNFISGIDLSRLFFEEAVDSPLKVVKRSRECASRDYTFCNQALSRRQCF